MKPKLKRIARQYTRTVHYPCGWTTYLKIDNQDFAVCDESSKRRADWFAEMLAIALDKLIKAENHRAKSAKGKG